MPLFRAKNIHIADGKKFYVDTDTYLESTMY